MTIEETLVERYGALMTITNLASLLDRSPASLRHSLRANDDWSIKLNDARLKIGRRIYFRTSQVAQLLEG
ncbi:MAG: DNA-binding protein [Candidatus Thiodiazotropha endolucinida]